MSSPTPFDKEFNLAIGKNALLKSRILSVFFGAITLGQVASFSIMSYFDFDVVKNLSIKDVYLIPIVMGVIFAGELWSFFYFSKAQEQGRQISVKAGYFLAFLEASMPSVLIYLICGYSLNSGILSKDNVLNGPPVFLYILFIIISALNLNFRLSVFTGLVSATQYIFLLFYVSGDEMHGVYMPLMIFKGVFFIICSVISGMVSLKIKESVLASLQSKNELISTLDFKVKEKTKEVEKQNELLAEKNKSITDSINYAKRIQTAILPPGKTVSQYLGNSFVLYLPKDVVSGDFYFVDKIENKVVFAAVDCTGHGVPGALMSVVGFNYLSQAVSEKKISKPSEILKFLDMGVNQTLRQSVGSGVNDGMDLSLCSLDLNSLELEFAGAFNPLWLIKKSSQNVCCEIKADKFPIGTNINGKADEYTNHFLNLEKGDTVYLFTDGFADQFGGPRGKKFKYKPLQEILISMQNHSMEKQKEILISTFQQWRGELEQVDDICIIGVRV